MEYLHSFIIGVVQGFTEFLPVSSSAHLAVLPSILKEKSGLLDSLPFSVVLHAGTLMAVLIFYRIRLIRIIAAFFKGLVDNKIRKTRDFLMGIYIAAATIPAVIFGILFKDIIENRMRECGLCIAGFLIIFALVLLAADRKGKKTKSMEEITLADALIIGCFQALALFPGVSRSGITITAGLFFGYKRGVAAEFSFLMSVPVIIGAIVFEFKDIVHSGGGGHVLVLLTGFAAAMVSGIAAIKLLIGLVKRRSYEVFVWYRIMAGGLIAFFVFKGII